MDNVLAQENFRANLRTALRARGISQAKLAELAETKQPYVNRVLQGLTSPSLEQCEKLARAAGYPLVALLSAPEIFDEAVLTTIP